MNAFRNGTTRNVLIAVLGAAILVAGGLLLNLPQGADVPAPDRDGGPTTESPAPGTIEQQREGAPSDALVQRLDALMESIDALAGKVASLEADMAALQQDDPTVERGPPPVRDAASMARKSERIREHLDSLDRLIQQEGLDDGYSMATAEQMETVIQGKREWASGAHLSTMQCGSTLCKFELTFDSDMEEIDRFELEHTLLAEIHKEMPNGRMQYRPLPDGGQQLVAYMGRNGGSLPPLDLNPEQR